MIDPKANADRLVRSTVKITTYSGDRPLAYGSGLLMQLKVLGPNDPNFAPVVVTNGHVVEGADWVEYAVPGVSGGPTVTSRSPAGSIVHHPDPSIDLCLIPVAGPLLQPGLHEAEFISSDDIWRMERLRTLTAIENIVMIGYPKGIVDRHRLYPIARRGITATPAFADLHGNSEFMIDCACFVGSSGSPVFLFDQGFYVDKANNFQFGSSRFGLLAFLHEGPALNEEEGEAVHPRRQAEEAQVYPLMMNLGNCIRAERLFEMFDLVAQNARR